MTIILHMKQLLFPEQQILKHNYNKLLSPNNHNTPST
jgi:hypothetical protein